MLLSFFHSFFLFFFCLVWRIDQALKKMQGGKAEKEMKEGEKEKGDGGKVVVHSAVCVLQPCVNGQKKSRRGGRGA